MPLSGPGHAVEHAIDEAGRFSGAESTSEFDGFVDGYGGRNFVVEEEFVCAEAEDGPVDPVQSLRGVVVYHHGQFPVDVSEISA